jgi:hypothetical protein
MSGRIRGVARLADFAALDLVDQLAESHALGAQQREHRFVGESSFAALDR